MLFCIAKQVFVVCVCPKKFVIFFAIVLLKHVMIFIALNVNLPKPRGPVKNSVKLSKTCLSFKTSRCTAGRDRGNNFGVPDIAWDPVRLHSILLRISSVVSNQVDILRRFQSGRYPTNKRHQTIQLTHIFCYSAHHLVTRLKLTDQ